MDESPFFLSVIIPAYNESKRLGKTLERVIGYLQERGQSFELIVVDDGSDDDTSAIAESFRGCCPLKVLRNEQNRGKGFSVKRGMLCGCGRFMLFSDADLSTPIEELEKLLPCVKSGEFEIAIGSRGLKESELLVRQSLLRELAGRASNLLIQLLAVPGIWDTQCGFKLFRKEAAQRLFSLQKMERFGFDFEVLYLARKFGYRIKEVPVRWVHSPESKVHPVKDYLRTLKELFKVRLNDWRGLYAVPTESERTPAKGG